MAYLAPKGEWDQSMVRHEAPLTYPRRSREEFGGTFLSPMPYLESKDNGNSSMAENQWS
jgi:hypothetical protein